MEFITITLGAAAKAMTDAVLPALLAAGDRQALEQAHLVRDAIEFARDRAELIGERRRAEALGLLELLGELLTLDAPGSPLAPRLTELRAAALRSLADPAADAGRWAGLGARMGQAVTAVLRAADDLDPGPRAAVERTVLRHALRGLELDRAWLLPLGFDPEPGSVRELSELLGTGRR
ncbi:hypothetical protein [Nocardia harenae]|uniref:hypothetical protein n=1 Tax=Nocardia harenae TaxID=358707 RepID=UPI000836764A|nr:hypothetical protein [Nocardia harenae]